MLAAIVMRIATGLLGERMQQHAALIGLAGHDVGARNGKIRAGALLAPGRATLGQRLHMHDIPMQVAGNAARVAVPLCREDRLNVGLEVLEVERGGRLLS